MGAGWAPEVTFHSQGTSVPCPASTRLAVHPHRLPQYPEGPRVMVTPWLPSRAAEVVEVWAPGWGPMETIPRGGTRWPACRRPAGRPQPGPGGSLTSVCVVHIAMHLGSPISTGLVGCSGALGLAFRSFCWVRDMGPGLPGAPNMGHGTSRALACPRGLSAGSSCHPGGTVQLLPTGPPATAAQGRASGPEYLEGRHRGAGQLPSAGARGAPVHTAATACLEVLVGGPAPQPCTCPVPFPGQ